MHEHDRARLCHIPDHSEQIVVGEDLVTQLGRVVPDDVVRCAHRPMPIETRSVEVRGVSADGFSLHDEPGPDDTSGVAGVDPVNSLLRLD